MNVFVKKLTMNVGVVDPFIFRNEHACRPHTTFTGSGESQTGVKTMKKLNRVLTGAVVCGAVVLGAGCGKTIEQAAAKSNGCVEPFSVRSNYSHKFSFAGSVRKSGWEAEHASDEFKRKYDIKVCMAKDVLRWKDTEGAVFQRVIASNSCPMRIVIAWCMGGGRWRSKSVRGWYCSTKRYVQI